MSLYSDLGLSEDASADAIKKAFRKKASETHPDKDGGDTKSFQVIQRAYAILGDEEKRKRYDESGETEDVPNIQTAAMQQLASIVIGIVENCEDTRYLNLIRDVSAVLARGKKQAEQSLETQNKRIKKLETALKKLERKKKVVTHDFLKSALEHNLKNCRAQLIEINKHIELGEVMQQLLKDYKYQADIVTPTRDPGSFSTLFTTTGGRW